MVKSKVLSTAKLNATKNTRGEELLKGRPQKLGFFGLLKESHTQSSLSTSHYVPGKRKARERASPASRTFFGNSCPISSEPGPQGVKGHTWMLLEMQRHSATQALPCSPASKSSTPPRTCGPHLYSKELAGASGVPAQQSPNLPCGPTQVTWLLWVLLPSSTGNRTCSADTMCCADLSGVGLPGSWDTGPGEAETGLVAGFEDVALLSSSRVVEQVCFKESSSWDCAQILCLAKKMATRI